jgi:hypothetical protein
MPETGAQLRHFLRAARVAARRLRIRAALADLMVAGGALLLVAGWLAAWSLRGDLAARWLPWAAGATAGLVVLATWRQTRHAGDRGRAAAAIARLGGPLARPPLSDAAVAAHRLLRHEILGAFELAETLRGEQRLPPGGQGSAALARHYIEGVETRLRRADIDPAYALPRPRWRPRAAAALAVALLGVATWVSGPLADGLGLLVAGLDARPPVPPRAVWANLTLELTYPPYTGRPPRTVPNPSGALRAVAGTVVTLQMTAREPAAGGRIVVSRDGETADDLPPPDVVDLQPTDDTGLHFTGEFTVRASGAWTVVLLDEADDALDDASRRSPALPLSREPDRAPEIELAPLRSDQREVRETDQVEIEFTARDDFGLASAELVYQLPDATAHRLPISDEGSTERTWRRRYRWDISQIPVSERSEVLYWIEVRDNDPGLGLVPLPDPPGKVSKSATARLVVRDDEAEHATNIVKLRDIRDQAVDLLAARMTSRAFPRPDDAAGAPPRLASRVAMARDILSRSGRLLAMLAEAIDALSMDTLTRERDVATLTEVHKRLIALHRDELKLHEEVPPGRELTDPDSAETSMGALAKHNEVETKQLEDEIIRLDDLVDGQIIERLEGLVARLEATQRKIVELLEQLAAGDESVRGQIEQLVARRREDLRRIAEARAMLRTEVDEEFMNLDAFAVLERMRQQGELEEMLERGEVDEALERARGDLDEVEGLRDEVQDRLGDATEAPQLSEEERTRMKLLRELSKLQDDESTLRAETRRKHESWREAVREQTASPSDLESARKSAASLSEALEEINDARLGREGRRGLDDAKEALRKLRDAGEPRAGAEAPPVSALDLAETAGKAARGLLEAMQGAESVEREGKALRRVSKKLDALQRDLDGVLPRPADTLPSDDIAELDEMRQRQRGIRQRAGELLKGELADPLPSEGRQAMRRADRAMLDAAGELDDRDAGQAVPGQDRAWQAIQQAIDSLRRGPPPPPPRASGDASTEADRDRSLRDELMDAMKEKPPAGYDQPVKRYYEELLR